MADPREHHTSGFQVNRILGIPTNNCVAIAWGHALASKYRGIEAHGNLGFVAQLTREVVRAFDVAGLAYSANRWSWWGSLFPAADLLQIEAELEKEELDRDKVTQSYDGWTGRRRVNLRNGYPTAAQWERQNRDVKKAVLRGTGHAGYMERDSDGIAHFFNMGARKRIDQAVILERV